MTGQNGVRKTAVSGSFYPGESDPLRKMVSAFLSAAPETPIRPRAIIVPHAGYIYSGAVAALAYKAAASRRKEIRTVILLGPSHRVPLEGIAAGSWEAFDSPLGPVPVEVELVRRAVEAGAAKIMNKAHEQEHSVEVQLPFLQLTLERFAVVPLVIGRCHPAEIAGLLKLLDSGSDSLIVVSSDLSHHLGYEQACELDRRTSAAIERLDWKQLSPQQACGMYPIRGLLAYAADEGLTATTIGLTNSGDSYGRKEEVVGYGAYLFS